MDEFSNALRELGIGCDEAQAERLYRIVDANSSDRVSYVEFVNAFKVVDASAQQQEKSGDWRDNVVQQVASVLFQHRIQMRSAFRMFDLNNDGHIKYVFSAIAGMCGSRMKRMTDMKISGSHISLLVLPESFSQLSGGTISHHHIHPNVHNSLPHFHVSACPLVRLPTCFLAYSAEEFQAGLRAINALLDPPLSSEQIEALRQALDRNGDGSVDYKEFLEGFQIVDVSEGGDAQRRRQPSL